MERTTIEIPKRTKQNLRQARLEHETNYGQTIERLLDNHDTPFVTRSEAKEIAQDQITQRVVPEAQR